MSDPPEINTLLKGYLFQMAGFVNQFPELPSLNEVDQLEKQLSINPELNFIIKIKHYYALLTKWNKTHNLTGVAFLRTFIVDHVLDSLTIVPLLKVLHPDTWLDLGSGAGFPAVPVYLALEDKPQLTLLEVRQKKTAFLRALVANLGMSGVNVVQERAEKWSKESSQQFDLVSIRALGKLKTSIQLALPYIRTHGHLVILHSNRNIDASEVVAVDNLEVILPHLRHKRFILMGEKV